MREYEMFHEILNLCPKNRSRDQFLEEIKCEDTDAYILEKFGSGPEIRIEKNVHPDESITYEVFASGMHHRFTFSEL